MACDLSPLGLRCGWGKDVGRIKEMIAMLRDILQVWGVTMGVTLESVSCCTRHPGNTA